MIVKWLTSFAILLLIVFFFFSRSEKAFHFKLGGIKSVSTFAYDEGRSASTYIDLSKDIELREQRFPEGAQALKHMPLFVNKGQLKNALIFADRKGLIALNLESRRPYWRAKSKGEINSTPVIDIKNEKIYFLSTVRVSENHLEHLVFEVNFQGRILQELIIPISKLLGFKEDYVPDLNCRTALGINQKVSPSYLYFACSRGSNYASTRGASGIVVRVNRDKKGSLKKDKISAFNPSKKTKNPQTGFDTGIYNSGSAPSVLSDGSVLVATGNGPTFFSEHNFGCSVVRLDGESFVPLIDLNKRPFAFSLNQKKYNECWYLNMEFAAAVSTITNKQKSYASIISKNGDLYFFSADQMQEESIQVIKHVGNPSSYSQTSMLFDYKKSLSVYSLTSAMSRLHLQDRLLIDEGSLDLIDDYSRRSCRGYLANNNDARFFLMYSGRLRDDYALVLEGSYLEKELTSFNSKLFGRKEGGNHLGGHFAPYRKVADLPKVSKSLQDYPELRVEEINLLSFIRQDIEKSFEGEFTAKILAFNGKRFREVCPDFANLVPLYEIFREEEFGVERGLHLKKFVLTRKGNLKNVKSLSMDNYYQTRSNLLVAYDIKNDERLLIFTAKGIEQLSSNESTLFVVSEQAQKIHKLVFKGTPHFSMPLVLNNYIFIATLNNGIKLFSL